MQRHLSNTYRQRPKKVRGYRAGLEPILKQQQAQRLPKKAIGPKALRRSRDSQLIFEANRCLVIGDRVFEAKCNIYYPTHTFVPYRYRRKSYKKFLLNFVAGAAERADKENLCVGDNNTSWVEIKSDFSVRKSDFSVCVRDDSGTGVYTTKMIMLDSPNSHTTVFVSGEQRIFSTKPLWQVPPEN